MNKTLLALLSLLLAVPLCASDLKVQADRWMPLNGTPQEKPPGYAVELLVNLFARDQDTVTYTLEPWGDALENTAAGKAHAVIGAASDEAPGLVFPQEPVGKLEYGLWAKADSSFAKAVLPAGAASEPRRLSTDELRKLLDTVKIGVIKGYTYWPELDQIVKEANPNIVVFTGDTAINQVLAALDKGEIGAYPEATAVFRWTLKEKGRNPDDYVVRSQNFTSTVYVAFTHSTRGKELAAKWDSGIAELRRSGVLAGILAKYGVVDWK